MIELHDENTQGRDFFVGDIHGQYDLLMAAMKGVEFDKANDRMFSVGDLIDRGIDSFKCLSLVFEPWFYGVRGNHEMLAYDALFGDGSGTDLWMMNGGAWALGENMLDVKQILGEAMRYLPYAREVRVGNRRIGMVHAEPPGDWTLIQMASKANQEQMVWGRTRIKHGNTDPVRGIDAVVVGHTIQDQPVTLGNVHYIDTGAFHTGNLTLIDAREVTA